MNFNIRSYLGKEFIIDDNLAIIRDPKRLDRAARYKEGEDIPAGFAKGQKKIIPLFTKIKVADVQTDARRNVFVFATSPDEENPTSYGWTNCTNLEDKFVNELITYIPDEWDLPPQGDNYTVVDKVALIRKGYPDFESTGQKIPVGTYVEVTGRSQQTVPVGKYFRVRHMEIVEGKVVAGEPIGWTLFSNVVPGNSKVFQTKAWLDQKGFNASWKGGKYIGPKMLIGIIGTGGQLQYISTDIVGPYLSLVEAAAKDNILLSINSGFRTFAKQERLYNGWKQKKPGYNLAAKPGRSNHQNGIALDLNTRGFKGTKVYDWLRQNAPKHGFIRTVNKEHWHWEYLPQEAAELQKQGTYKIDRVKI